MSRPKKPSAFLVGLRTEVDELSGIDRKLVDPLLVEADALLRFVMDLRSQVEAEGTMVEKEVRDRVEMVENPALTAYSKNIGRLGDLAKKISSFAKTAHVEKDDDDGFDELVNS